MRTSSKIIYYTNMSLVENLINQISTQGLNGITSPLGGVDLNDDTFSKLLDKQLNSLQDTNPQSNFIGNFGIPAGLVIEPIDGTDFAEIAQDQMEIIGETKLSKEEYINQPIEFKDIDLGDHFSNLVKTNLNNNTDFMNFARKNATNAYNIFSKNFVTNMQDFVEDISSTL